MNGLSSLNMTITWVKWIMKVDLVMWTKNGAKTLRPVLTQINSVIPKENVNQRLIVDDGSSDRTRLIAEECGWIVISNKGKGISDGANTALRHVETPYFCSFEQDIILCRGWWQIHKRIVDKSEVAVASGMRFLPGWHPVSALERHTFMTLRGQIGVGRTLDNTMYNTEILNSFGGFPKMKLAGIDTVLSWVVEAKGYRWIVDYSTQSLHYRNSLLEGLRRQAMYAKAWKEVYKISKQLTGQDFPEIATERMLFKRLLRSPFIGLFLAFEQRNPFLPFYYPLFQVFNLNGFHRGDELL